MSLMLATVQRAGSQKLGSTFGTLEPFSSPISMTITPPV